MSNDGTVGYWFEEKVRLALIESSKRLPVKAVRLYDSKSAGAGSGSGNWLPEQPGDMIWMVAGVGLLVELKASDSTRSLNIGYKKKMKPAQVAGARLWLRAGGGAVVIFCGRSDRVVEIWDAYHVVEAWRNGWPKIKAEPLEAFYNVPESNVQSVVQSWIHLLVEQLKNEGTYLHRSSPGCEADG